MKTKIIIFFLLIVSFQFYINCSDSATNPGVNPMENMTQTEKSLTIANNQFGLNLLKKINENAKDENIFISPLSISMALGMTYNGAAGETATEMKNILGYGELTKEEINIAYKNIINGLYSLDPKVKFNLANSIWNREGFNVKDDFINLNQNYFDAEIRSLDFSKSDAVDIINDWIENNTNGKIKDMLEPPINSATIMFLINAIYFKGDWTYQFKEEDTRDATFFHNNGETSIIKLMSLKEEFKYYTNSKFQAIDIPYSSGDFTMTVILPNNYEDMQDYITNLTSNEWNNLLSNFKSNEVQLFLPKFKLKYKNGLKDELIDLGMKKAFTNADFSNITDEYQLFISEVLHQSFLEVNEEGTEAAAATIVEMRLTSVEGDNSITMRIDRPFFFTIRERVSGTILFCGKIMNPVWEE